MTDRTIPPSARGAIRDQEDAERKAKATAELDRVKQAMNEVFNSPSGIIVLQWLAKECGHNEPILGALQGGIDEKATLYQAMRLNLYLKLRKFLPFNILKEVEFNHVSS